MSDPRKVASTDISWHVHVVYAFQAFYKEYYWYQGIHQLQLFGLKIYSDMIHQYDKNITQHSISR